MNQIKGKNKRLVLLVSVVLITVLLAMVGVTIAYLTDTTEEVTNKFTSSEVPNRVVEEVLTNPNYINDVKIENLGDIDAYIRVEVIVNWVDDGRNIYGIDPVEGTDYGMEWTGISDNTWIEGSDGYYYYTEKVSANDDETELDLTGKLFTECHQLGTANVPDGYHLSVEIIAQSIQADGNSLSDVTENDGNKDYDKLYPVVIAWEAVTGIDNNGSLIVTPKSGN